MAAGETPPCAAQAAVAVAVNANHSPTAGVRGAAVCPGSAGGAGGGQHRLGLRAWFVHPLSLYSVSRVTVSAGDRLNSAVPQPREKLRHRGTTCPRVTLGVCGDTGLLASPKAGWTSAWGGMWGLTSVLHSLRSWGWGGGASHQASPRTGPVGRTHGVPLSPPSHSAVHRMLSAPISSTACEVCTSPPCMGPCGH